MIKIREMLGEKADDLHDRITAQARAKWLTRWAERTEEITGRPCESPDDIDYTDPYIHIEWLLCDPTNQARIQSKDPEARARFFDQLTAEELAVYYEKDEKGASYSDMETVAWKREVVKGVKKLKKR